MNYLQRASISCWPSGADADGRARNSLCSYLARIQRSLSSRLDCGLGLLPLSRASQMLLLTVLPSPSITAMWPGLQQNKNEMKSNSICGNLWKFVEICGNLWKNDLRKTYGHSSRSRERTREMWDPKFRWIPEHSMQTRMPRLRLAQSGSTSKILHSFYWINSIK